MKIYITKTKNTITFGERPFVCFSDCTNESEMVWSEPYNINLPDGYKTAKNKMGVLMLYNPNGQHVEMLANVDSQNDPTSVTLIDGFTPLKKYKLEAVS